ncbi:hypothetical protein TIFTF001_051157 [Ficus carica]|uniref:Uncharacterized protein n=1 Tax=Ficus carica TaxID=3494 RepID=A0AA87YSF0_FICCA|nr:hypothetical protein TIFTF001_051157 [Ficus carica]
MLVRLPTSYNDQGFLPMSFNEQESTCTGILSGNRHILDIAIQADRYRVGIRDRFPAIPFHSLLAIATIIVSLGSRCLIGDARLWWILVGEPQLPSRTWVHFRTLVTAWFGPILDYGPGAPQRDPDIYRDMYDTRYHSYTLEWHAYPLETMAHYCLRFHEAMLPYVPQNIDHPVMEALTILRNGLPGRIRQYVPFPTPRMTVGHMIEDILGAEVHADTEQAEATEGDHQAPVDDAGIGKPLYEVGPAPPEEPIPTVPEQEVPAHEAEEQEDAEGDPDAEGPEEDDVMVIPADPPADPLIIDISSDEEDDIMVIPADPPADALVIDISSDEEGDDEDMEPEPELEQAGWLEDQEDFGDDPEEILFDDGDWEADSDALS